MIPDLTEIILDYVGRIRQENKKNFMDHLSNIYKVFVRIQNMYCFRNINFIEKYYSIAKLHKSNNINGHD